jgi:hypothetical protein
MGTREQRAAGVALIVLGVVNALVGLLGVGTQPVLFGVVTVIGLAFVAVGWLVRGGSRQAAVVALVMLGLLLALELFTLVQNPSGTAFVRPLITLALGFLTLRALQSA